MYPILLVSTRVENEKKTFKKSNVLGKKRSENRANRSEKVIVVDGRVRQMPFRREHDESFRYR